jgi:hypothetical protein
MLFVTVMLSCKDGPRGSYAVGIVKQGKTSTQTVELQAERMAVAGISIFGQEWWRGSLLVEANSPDWIPGLKLVETPPSGWHSYVYLLSGPADELNEVWSALLAARPMVAMPVRPGQARPLLTV